MRYTIYLLGIALALYSCAKPSQEGSEGQGAVETSMFKEYIFALEGVDHLKEGDSFMVFVPCSESALTSQVIVTDEGAMLPLKLETAEGIVAGDAIYAYSPGVNSASGNPSEVALSIPAVQKQAGLHFDLSCFPIVSEPFIADCTLPVGRKELAGTISVNPLYAVARFDICVMQNFNDSQVIKSVAFVSDGIAGEFTYDLTSGSSEIPVLGNNTITTQVEGLSISSVGAVVSVYMALAPGVHTGTAVAKIGDAEVAVDLEDVVFERGSVTPIAMFVQGDIVGGGETFDPSEEFDWEK